MPAAIYTIETHYDEETKKNGQKGFKVSYFGKNKAKDLTHLQLSVNL